MLKNHTQNVLEKLFPDPYVKKSKWSISLNAIVCYFEGYRNIVTSSCRPLAFTEYKVFLLKKGDLELVSRPHFLHDFEEKYFSWDVLLTDQILLSGCL